MYRASKVYICVLAALLSCQVSGAVLTAEHFNYGPAAQYLVGLNGGPNWGGSWQGYDNLSPAYDPAAGLSYFDSCYSDECSYSDTLHGGAVHQSYRGIWRPYDSELTGVVWVSALTQPGGSSARGFGLGDIDFESIDFRFVFGLTNEPRVYAELRGHERVEGDITYSTSDAHLLIAKIEINSDASGQERLSIWVDPLDTCSGETGLGDPDALVDGHDVAPSWAVLMFELGNGSRADAIRISHGGDASLEAVLPCEPASPVESSSWSRVKTEYR